MYRALSQLRAGAWLLSLFLLAMPVSGMASFLWTGRRKHIACEFSSFKTVSGLRSIPPYVPLNAKY